MSTVKVLFSAVCGIIAAFCEQYGLFFYLVIGAVVFDFVTGLIKAQISGEGLDSKKAHKGFWKKVSLFVALGLGVFLDFIIENLFFHIGAAMPVSAPVTPVIACYIVINECISVAENLYLINPHSLPDFIAKWLKVANEDIGN